MKTTKTFLIFLSLVGFFLPFTTNAAIYSCEQGQYVDFANSSDRYWSCNPRLPAPLPENCSDNLSFLGLGARTVCVNPPIGYGCTQGQNGLNISCENTPSTPAATSQQVRNTACPNQKPGELCYTPLEPFPGVDQSGSRQSLESLLNFIFKTLFTVGGLIAVLFLILGGLAYMTSEVAHKKDEAKKRIAGAIYGLVILAVSWIILNEINPDLLRFDFQPQQAGPSRAPPPFVQYNATPGTTVYTCYEYDDNGRSRPTRSMNIKNSEVNTQTGAVITKFTADCERNGYVKTTSV